MLIDRKKFFESIRPYVNLTTENVLGFGKHLDYIEGARPAIHTNHAAYALATSYWETSSRMTPIREYGSEKYLKSKPYYPYVGMGLIQPTWKDNWIKAAKLLGLPEDHFIKFPMDLLKWEYALPLLFVGMEKGLYTGKDLNDYIDDIDESDEEDLKEYVAARHIVNGVNKATDIGRLAVHMEHGLRDAGYVIDAGHPITLDAKIVGTEVVIPNVPTPTVIPVKPAPAPLPEQKPISTPAAKSDWITMIVQAIVAAIRSATRRQGTK